MNNLEDKELEQIFQTSEAIKVIKKEKLTSLVKDMTIIEKKGLNLFVVSKNINDLGLKTVSFEDIAKTVIDEPSLKSEVLDATKRGISPEELEKQMEVIVEAEKLVIEHTVKADHISWRDFSNKENKVYGKMCEIAGNAASQIQFHVTDSTKHFIKGSLFFYVKPNYDSILPAVAHIKKDMIRMMESLQWEN